MRCCLLPRCLRSPCPRPRLGCSGGARWGLPGLVGDGRAASRARVVPLVLAASPGRVLGDLSHRFGTWVGSDAPGRLPGARLGQR